MDFPSSFYIRDLTEKQYEEIRLLADNSYWIQIINQKEMKEEVLKAERTKHLIVALVLILCCVYCFVNIQTQQSLENRLREGENELLTSLGVPRKTVIATRSLENAMVFILGGLLDLILIFVLYEVMFDFGIVNGQMNVWSFVLESLVVITAFTCASFIMDFTRQWKVNARSGQ